MSCYTVTKMTVFKMIANILLCCQMQVCCLGKETLCGRHKNEDAESGSELS